MSNYEEWEADITRRAYQATALALAFQAKGITNVREIPLSQWGTIAASLGHEEVGARTRAATTAILDVREGRLTEKAAGSAGECKSYNTFRIAARIAAVLVAAGASNVEDIEAKTWRHARMVAGVSAPSEISKVAAAGILAVSVAARTVGRN